MPNEFIARKDGSYKVIFMMPDVCKLPNNIPVPFPIMEALSGTAKTAKKSKCNGKLVIMLKSKTKKVTGDQAGVAKGLKSGKVAKAAEGKKGQHCPITKCEKSKILRVGDKMDMNKKNTIGKIVFVPAPVEGAIKDNGAINV